MLFHFSKASALRRESHKTEKEMEDLIALQQGFTVKLDKVNPMYLMKSEEL